MDITPEIDKYDFYLTWSQKSGKVKTPEGIGWMFFKMKCSDAHCVWILWIRPKLENQPYR